MSTPTAVPAASDAGQTQASAQADARAAAAPSDYLARGTPALRRAQWALFAAGFSTFSLLYCVQPLMPLFTHSFDVSPAQSSLVLSLFASAVLGTVAAVAPDWHSLLALRALQGVAMGGVPAVAMAYLA